MTDLIKRFNDDLELAGYAQRSIQSYVAAVLKLQRFYNKPLEDITQEDLRQYWLSCKEELGWSNATLRISYSGIKHFFSRTFVREWPLLDEVHFKRDETLPTVLSRQEVKTIINALPSLHSRTFYRTLYSLGLRLSEARNLEIRDIYADRSLVHIRSGKGYRDRMVPLPDITLKNLRAYYSTHRNPTLLFPALGHNNSKNAGKARKPVSEYCLQSILQQTVKRLGIKKHVHPHVFRHSYATHLIEANVPIRHVQILLGHKRLQSTMVYIHVTTQAQTDSQKRVMQIMQGVLS